MAITKIVLDITLPGSQMYTREQAKSAPKDYTEHNAVWVRYEKWNKVSKKKEEINECLHIFTRKSIPAHQSINLSVEAYEWMTSKESRPFNIKSSIWDKMSKKERLEYHLREYMLSRGGTSFTYDILPD